MFPLIKVTIRSFERGFLFREGELVRLLAPGKHLLWNARGLLRVDVSSLRQPWLQHADLDLIVKSGLLGDEATVLDLAQHERALVWIDDRFDAVVGPGRHVLWTGFRRVRVERVDAHTVRFAHAELGAIVTAASAGALLERLLVPQGAVGLVYQDGALRETLPAGDYAFWKGVASLRLYAIDAREAVLDVAGQEIMTKDKVTLRMNALVTFRVTDAARAVTTVEDFKQALYREAQLALRAAVGTRSLDELLADKNESVAEVLAVIRARAEAFGLEIVGFGIRDLILPGEMKLLLNRVTEAQKAAEAALITRREETAAMRNQANTARLLEGNPVLMRLRELEVIERVAQAGKISVVAGDKGIGERILNLL
jgi:regulator of protease activity HflC (stomatin/prohibitin superfamily)